MKTFEKNLNEIGFVLNVTNTKHLEYCSIPMPVDYKPNIKIIHIVSNDITKWNYHTINSDELAKGINSK